MRILTHRGRIKLRSAYFSRYRARTLHRPHPRCNLNRNRIDTVGAPRVSVDFLGGKTAFSNGINMDLLRLRIALGRMDWKNFSLVAGQDWSVFARLNPT